MKTNGLHGQFLHIDLFQDALGNMHATGGLEAVIGNRTGIDLQNLLQLHLVLSLLVVVVVGCCCCFGCLGSHVCWALSLSLVERSLP